MRCIGSLDVLLRETFVVAAHRLYQYGCRIINGRIEIDVGKALSVLVESHRTLIRMNNVVSINAIVGNTMQLLYLIHGENVCGALWHVLCLNSSVLPLLVCIYAPSVAVHLHSLFFGLDGTDVLGSFEGCDGRAVVQVSLITREFLPLQHGHLD